MTAADRAARLVGDDAAILQTHARIILAGDIAGVDHRAGASVNIYTETVAADRAAGMVGDGATIPQIDAHAVVEHAGARLAGDAAVIDDGSGTTDLDTNAAAGDRTGGHVRH